MKNYKVRIYLYSILMAVAVGGLSGLLSGPGMKQFAGLNKPPLTPPGPVFPIVWTILFILMGISAAMVITAGSRGQSRRKAMSVYALQLVVNFFWSILFFGFGLRLAAFFWLLLLVALVAVMIGRFAALSRTAAALQVPYLLWLCFAGYLNLAIWMLNR